MPAFSCDTRPPATDLLPPEVSLTSGWFSRARSFPIFSHRWWQYRSRALVAGGCIA
ncbi:hypothetical protein [Massilia sp. TWP1-3-3]|uniref:hypothetical protein n=1 Tax=Massilia sp. TWP1-3-3 TaxID=2804573 RepID=UPI003CF5ADAF